MSSQRASTSSQRKSRPNRSAIEEPSEDLEEMASNFVRYVIVRAGSGLPIKKADLQEYTARNALTFNTALERAKVALLETYGYELRELDTKVKSYTVANVLPHVDVDSDEEEEVVSDEESVDDADKVLVLLVLTHIFMSNGCAGDRSLMDYLSSFNIEMEQTHPIFGSIKDFLHHLVKAKYITTEVEQGGAKKLNYRWGEKAEKEISKLEILKFVARISGAKRIQNFGTQYTEAMEQCREEEKNLNEEVDDESE